MIQQLLFIAMAMATLSNTALADTQPIQGRVVFALCPSNVEQIMLRHKDGGVVIDIKLTDSASKTFANLTKRSKGQVLSLMVDDHLLSQSTIRGEVITGRFRSNAVTSDEAEQLEKLLGNKPSSIECGVIRGY